MRITGFTTMRYINRLFTYLLTNCLPNFVFVLGVENGEQ